MKIFSIQGNSMKLDGGGMFGSAPKSMWEKWMKPDGENRIGMATRALLISTERFNILCETGTGVFLRPALAERYGVDLSENVLMKSLNEAGFDEADIHYVIHSHMHFDHIGGLIKKPGTGASPWEFYFPNAKYIISLESFTHAQNPHPGDRASFIQGLTEGLKNSGRLILINETKPAEIPPEIEGLVSFVFTNGHTPGQLHSLFSGKKEKVFFTADLIPGTPWVNLPVTMAYDRFAERVIDEKKIYMDMAIDENWLVFYNHDPVYAASRIQRGPGGRYEPVGLLKELKGYELD